VWLECHSVSDVADAIVHRAPVTGVVVVNATALEIWDRLAEGDDVAAETGTDDLLESIRIMAKWAAADLRAALSQPPDVERLGQAILANVSWEPDISRFVLYEDDGPEVLAQRIAAAYAEGKPR
jgi:hypothetical protein